MASFLTASLRTLQRRVRLWRMRIVQQLVYGTGQTVAHNDEAPSYITQMESPRGDLAPAVLAEPPVARFATLTVLLAAQPSNDPMIRSHTLLGNISR